MSDYCLPLSRALWRTVYALARLRACAYMCRFVNCRCVWVAFCVEWASLFFFQGHSCNGMRQMCTPLPVCFCVFVWDVWYAVGDAIVFMCDSHIVSEEEVSLKGCNVPDRNADWSVNSSSFHSECVFSELVILQPAVSQLEVGRFYRGKTDQFFLKKIFVSKF